MGQEISLLSLFYAQKRLERKAEQMNKCLVCGKEVKEKRRKYCSQECYQSVSKTYLKKQRTIYESKTCEICGKPLNRKQLKAKGKYCSCKCASIAKKRKPCICKNCEKEFRPKMPDRTTFCSRECAYEYRSAHKNPKKSKAKEPTAYSKQCAFCGTSFETTYKNQIYCSSKCRDMVTSSKQKTKKRDEFAPTSIACQNCGKTFATTFMGSKLYCSDECKRNHANHYRDIYRRHKLKENGTIQWDITLKKLIKRDKNICHICGGECDIKDYKLNEQGSFVVGGMYPSIDHVQPVSKGGTHTWDNVKLAHHHCNTVKSNNCVYAEGCEQLKLVT